MKQYPSLPSADDAPAGLFDSGHLWLQEQVPGGHLRVRLRESGLLQFGGRTRTFGSDEIPLPYRHAVRHVRERFDREALRASRDDPSSVVFFGVATYRRGVDYDWNRLPSFLGFDVWDEDSEGNGEDGQFLPPDAVEQVYDRLGLDAVNAFEKEVRATDFDPRSYEVPDSAWYDGPAAGVVARNKTGQRARIPNDGVAEATEAHSEHDPDGPSAETLADELITRQRVENVASELENGDRRATFDAVFERVVEAVAREERPVRDDDSTDVGAFRSAVAARVQHLLET